MIYAGLLAFFFLEYVRPTSYIPALMVLKLNSLVPLSTFAATVLTTDQGTARRALTDPNTRMIALILLMIWVSFLTADVGQYAWITLTIVFGFVLMYWVIVCQVDTVSKLKGVSITLIIVHLVVAALNPVLFTDPETRHYITSGSFLGDGNDFALSIVIILPLCLFLLLEARRLPAKLVWAGALLVLTAVVVLTQSRGGTIGLACMGAYYWKNSQHKLQTGILAALVLALILALAPGNYFERIRTIGDTSEGSASARLTAWEISLQMALDNPLLGVGAGHFGVKIGNEYRPAGFVGSGMTAHSIYFLALGELGFPGFFVLLSYIIWNLRANTRLKKELLERQPLTRESDVQLLASTSAALIAFASAGAFLSAIYYPHMYVLAGLLTATRHVVRQRMAATADATATEPVRGREVTLHWALRPRSKPVLSGQATGRPHCARRAAGRGQPGR
jgi:putative inorganic carbon (HCO3(-)) transporter